MALSEAQHTNARQKCFDCTAMNIGDGRGREKNAAYAHYIPDVIRIKRYVVAR